MTACGPGLDPASVGSIVSFGVPASALLPATPLSPAFV
jgi:hypothetical protein